MNWKELLKQKAALVSDGAWGTELAKRGLQPGTVPESWNADRPDAVQAVAAGYVEAGSDIILTNSFGGCRLKLEKVGLADRLPELNRLAAEISKRAAGARALVFASIGPTGELMAPLGLKTEQEFVDCFTEQIRACIDGGADGIAIETMTDLGETKAALRAARQVGSFPVVASMTFDHGPGGFATMMGVKPGQAAAELDAAGADIIGSNCGSGVENMIEIARLMRSATKKPPGLSVKRGVLLLRGKPYSGVGVNYFSLFYLRRRVPQVAVEVQHTVITLPVHVRKALPGKPPPASHHIITVYSISVK